MKKSVLAIICAMATVGAYAQGTVSFQNIGGGINAPVFNVDGTTALSGAGFMAQLYAGADASSLAAVGAPVGFQTGGYFLGGVVTVASVAPGATGSFQVRAWDVSTGADYANATTKGESITLQIATGGAGSPPSTPSALTGLQSFNLAIVPEPTTVALGLIGAAALLLRRRK